MQQAAFLIIFIHLSFSQPQGNIETSLRKWPTSLRPSSDTCVQSHQAVAINLHSADIADAAATGLTLLRFGPQLWLNRSQILNGTGESRKLTNHCRPVMFTSSPATARLSNDRPSRRGRLSYCLKLGWGHWGFRGVESLFLRFNSHLPGEPGLAGVKWSKGWWRWWWLLEL